MRCQRCGKEISPLRQLSDRQFCGEYCRRRGARASASIMRDMEYDADPLWQSPQTPLQKPPARASAAVLAVAVTMMVVALVAIRIWYPDTGPAAGQTSPLARTAPTTRPEGAGDGTRADAREAPSRLMEWVEKHLPGDKPLRADVDFGRGWSSQKEWTATSDGWARPNNVVLPGVLRLWKPTLQAKDYEFDFSASIEKRAVGWVYRARDASACYRTKILLPKPGSASTATIERWSVMGGMVFRRVELPLPVTLQAGKPYRFTALVDGDRFSTLIDGRVVDEWRDSRLASGGVGFFSDSGESAALAWASFREHKGVLERFLAAQLIIPPGMLD